MTFGAMLRERRLQLVLSQETVADRAQLHRTYLSMVERGVHRKLSLETFTRLAWALEITPSAMIERYAESDDAP